MNYFVTKYGQQQGPFTEEQVRGMLRDGTVTMQDSFWREGMPDWKPLSEWESALSGPAAPFHAPLPPPPTAGAAAGSSQGLIIAGYICAALSLLFCPALFALAGTIIGIILVMRKVYPHGPAVIVASVLGGVVGTLLGATAFYLNHH